MLVARDRTAAPTDAMIDTVATGNVKMHLGGVVQAERLLITDGETADAGLAKA